MTPNFNAPPFGGREVAALVFCALLAASLLIAAGVAVLEFVPGPVVEFIP